MFAVLIVITDLTQVETLWKHGRPLQCALAASLSIPVIVVKAWRWRLMLNRQGIRCGPAASTRHYAIACALGAWTPGRIGDFSKALALRREFKVGPGRAASSVIADRLLDALLLGAVAACGAVSLAGGHDTLLFAASATAVSGVAWLVIRLVHAGSVPALRRAARWCLSPARRAVQGFGAAGDECRAAMEDLAVLLRPRWGTIGATFLAALIVWLQGWIMARGLGMSVDILPLAIALSASSITSLIPISVAGFGTREATLALFLVPVGVTMPQVIGFSLAYFVVISGTVALIGALAWTLNPRSPGEARASAVAPDSRDATDTRPV